MTESDKIISIEQVLNGEIPFEEIKGKMALFGDSRAIISIYNQRGSRPSVVEKYSKRGFYARNDALAWSYIMLKAS